MRHITTIILLLLALSFLSLPVLSSAEVKILLKNGREIIADSCWNQKDKLICEKMGGTFEVEQKDIQAVKNLTIQRENMRENPAHETAPGEEGKKSGGEMPDVRVEDPKKPSALTTENNIRLDRLNQRKRELIADRERLIQDREKLNEEFKKQGDMLTSEAFDLFQKRFKEVDARVNSFNAEVKEINTEEQAILGNMQRNSESVK